MGSHSAHTLSLSLSLSLSLYLTQVLPTPTSTPTLSLSPYSLSHSQLLLIETPNIPTWKLPISYMWIQRFLIPSHLKLSMLAFPRRRLCCDAGARRRRLRCGRALATARKILADSSSEAYWYFSIASGVEHFCTLKGLAAFKFCFVSLV